MLKLVAPLALAVVLGSSGPAHAVPIPSDHPGASLSTFTGKPAASNPIKSPSIPRHPRCLHSI